MGTRKSDARGGIPGRLDLVACGLPADADGHECSTNAETVVARFDHERRVEWSLVALRHGRETAYHAELLVELVRGRDHPVAGHAARVALGLGVRS